MTAQQMRMMASAEETYNGSSNSRLTDFHAQCFDATISTETGTPVTYDWLSVSNADVSEADWQYGFKSLLEWGSM